MTAPTPADVRKIVEDSTGIEYRDSESSASWVPSAVHRTPDEVARLNELVGYEKYRAVAS